MWFLAWIGILLGLTTAGTAATYVAVAHLGVLERIVAVVLRKGLKGLTLRDAAANHPEFRVMRIPGGIRMENFQLARSVLDKAGIFSVAVEAASIQYLEVTFPTWTSPFRLKLRGLQFIVQQRNMPPHTDAKVATEKERAEGASLKQAKLAAIDRLLWGTKATASKRELHPEGTYGSRLRARVVHRLLAFGVQYVEVDAENLGCSYMQNSEPGPLPNPDSHMEGRDGADVGVRRLLLLPLQHRHASSPIVAETDEGDLEMAAESEAEPRLSSLLQLFKIPSAIWVHMTLNEPRSTRAVISGVSVSLYTFGRRQPPSAGKSNTEPVPVLTTEQLQTAQLVFTGGVEGSTGSAPGRSRLGSQEGAPPSSVRRKRPRNGGVRTAAEPASPGTPLRPKVVVVKEKPSETHVIVRQWGADLTLVVLPPLYALSPPVQTEAVPETVVLDEHRSDSAMGTLRKPVPSPFANGEVTTAQPDGSSNRRGLGDSKAQLSDVGRSYRSERQSVGRHDSWLTHQSDVRPDASSVQSSYVCTVELEVKLRALVPHVTPQSLAVAFRMLDRAQEYSQYAAYWQSRPSVPVTSNPSGWWQHAGSAAARECKLISRRQVPLRGIAARRLNRLRYQELYARTHSRLSSFTEPNRRWWQRRQTPKGGSEDAALLKALEEVLGLEEIAHFRAGVAAVHSSAMLDDPNNLYHALDAVDAVVGNLGPLPAPVAAMLFQNEPFADTAPSLVFSASFSCPKVGVSLTIEGDRNPLTAPLPDKQFSCLEARICDISCTFGPKGDVGLSLGSVTVDGQQSEESKVKEHLLQSPSAAANRMLQVADLHGVVSKARSFGAQLKSGSRVFLTMRLSPQKGRWDSGVKPGQRTTRKGLNETELKPSYAAIRSSAEEMDLRPPGVKIEVELSGIEVEYNHYIVVAALRFATHLGQLKDQPLVRFTEDLGRPPVGRQLPELKADPGQPATLSERVFHAFAQQNMPVYKPLSLPVTRIKLSCPGLAARVPYTHAAAIGCQEAFTEATQHHELIAALTRVKLELGGEDFREFMRKGATQRSTLHAYLDLFCYQPPAFRRRRGDNSGGMTRATAFGNRTISGQRRESSDLDHGRGSDDVDSGDGEDMAAMAKVWAHPEDLPKYPLSRLSTQRSTRTSFSGALPAAARAAGSIPAFPMIPLLKVSGLQMEATQKVLSLPAAPGSLTINAAASLHGIMVWISPWQVAHLLSIMEAVRRDLPAAGPPTSSPAASQKAGASAMRTQLRIQASLEIPLISAICSVARSQAELEAAIYRPLRAKHGRPRNQIPPSDPAYLWSQCLAPTYGINILGCRAAISFKGTGHMRGGLTIDGLLVRDLQLQPTSKFAYFLRPLPARAEELTQHATKFRTRMLRVVSTSTARRRWYWAVRKVILRRRSALPANVMEARMFVETAALPFTSFVGLKTTGPQFVACCYLPPAHKYPGHPDFKPAPPAKLQIQVGQLLLYARVSSNNRMLPFCSQIIELVAGMSQPKSPRVPEGQSASLAVATSSKEGETKQCGATFAGLLVDLGMVGMDLKIVVQGRELVSLQLLDAALTLDMAPSPPPGPGGNSMALNLRIVDISIRDLQAIPEHSMVLRPNKNAEHCSLALDFLTPLNPKQAALLVIEFASPRILALFRFVYDILHGINIINSAFAKNGGIFPASGGAPAPPPASGSGEGRPPPEILIHLTDAGVVLPASSKSLKVLVADVDYVMLGMPGSSLSDTALNSAGLPTVTGMLRRSIKAARLFRPETDCPRTAPPKPTPFAAGAEQPPSSSSPAFTRPGGSGGKAAAQSNAKARRVSMPHILKQDVAAGMRNTKQQAGVLFVGSNREPTLPQVHQKGVLNVRLGDEPEEAVADASGQSAPVIDTTAGVDRDGGRSASASGRQHEGATPRGPAFTPQAFAPQHVLPGARTRLPGEAGLEHEGGGEDRPEAMIAIFAEGIIISRAALASVDHNQKRRDDTFCPKSVFHFAWPVLDFGIVDRSPFVQPSSYSIVMYEQKCPQMPGGAYQHLHLAAAPVVVILNAPNYAALLGFAQGNLTEISSYDSSRGRSEQKDPQRTKFNPAFQFAPPKGDMPTFRMTAGLPLITTVFEADPRHWQSGAIRSRLGDPGDIPLLPFMRVRLQSIEMDLGLLQRSGATYMEFSVEGAACDDLRLAYSKIMTEYEVYNEDTFEELPTQAPPPSRSPEAGGGEFSTVVPEVAARVASELTEPTASSHRSSRDGPKGRRERSSEFLRLKSVQIQRADQELREQAAAVTERSRVQREDISEEAPRPSAGVAPIPVLSMEVVNSLEAYFPAGSPVVHLLKAPAAFLATEAAHLSSGGQYKEASDVVKATIALLKDGTIAIEVYLSTALVQWPFLTDISLAWAAASIFDSNSSDTPGEDPPVTAATNAADAILTTPEHAPWLYFNCILQDSQLFIPVTDPETLLDGVNFYFGGGAAAMNLHERLADLLLMGLSFSMEDPEMALSVEERGLSISWSALRVAYAMGGDGESDVKADLRHLAAFVRDPSAIVTCLLLPFSCSAHMEMKIPQAFEREMARRQLKAVMMIQRAWRRFRWQRAAERSRAKGHREGEIRARGSGGRPPIMGFASAARQAALEAGLPAMTAWSQQQNNASLMEQLVQEVASPRTHSLLKEYYEQSKAAGGTSQLHRPASSMAMRLKLGDCTFRAAFSHVPFIQSIIWMTNTMVLQPSPGNLTADSNHHQTLSAVEMEAAARDFRPSSFQMDGSMQSVSLVLCNDKPQTFGAPDVLRLSVDQLVTKYAVDQRFHDRPPDQVAQADLNLGAQFLNNSSSRWEAICESWQVQAELVDSVSPIYRSDFQRHIWLTSKQHLSVYFNPSSLLSIGDFMAFANAVGAPMPNHNAVIGQSAGESAKMAAPEAAPEMHEQMAQRGSITSRVPQKYLIQNQSGLRVYYWVEEEGEVKVGPVRTNSLDSGVSETLKVVPRRKVLQHITPGRGSMGKVQNVVNLHFEGNWMPIKDVAVSVVGKYRYHMYSPAEHDRAPVIVDIILVGRTKIITLHSGIWLENHMDRKLSFRLHVPITPLVAPVRRVDERQRDSDEIIGPLKPGGGTYLPVTAVLGGLLFVRPSGFQEARRDVIRLSPVVSDIEAQQGHITCDPLPPSAGGPAVQAPLHCSLILRAAQVNSEFQAFKHIEMLAPGQFTRATESLEATLSIEPTLVLTNALPYVMEVIVWQVPPFRKLRQERTAGRRATCSEYLYYDFQQMRTAFTGTVPIIGESNPYAGGNFDEDPDEQQEASVRPASQVTPQLPRGHSRALSLLTVPEPQVATKRSPGNASSSSDGEGEGPNDMDRQLRKQARRQFRRNRGVSRLAGEHISVTLAPGASQNVYADMGGNVLVHVAVPSLGLVAMHWAVVSWSKQQIQRESFFDAKYVYRLPKEIKLRNSSAARFLPSQIKGVTEYVSKLKAAGTRFREAAHRRKRRKEHSESSDSEGPYEEEALSNGAARELSRHIKRPSEATPVGPAVPTVMPSEDPSTPRGGSEGGTPPQWFNALYSSNTPSNASDSSEKSPGGLQSPGVPSIESFAREEEARGAAPGGGRRHTTVTFEASDSKLLEGGGSPTPPPSSFSFRFPVMAVPPLQAGQASRAAPPQQQAPRREGTEPVARSSDGEIQPQEPEGSGPTEALSSSMRSLGVLRAAFDAWRERAVQQATRKPGGDRQSTEPGVNAPELLLLTLQNSLSDPDRAQGSPVCHLSFFSPFWVDNRTNMDLILRDHASAAPNPMLLGYKTPLDYAQVVAPAVGLIEPETPGGTHRSFWDIDNPQEIRVQPALLNKQDTTKFCLVDVPKKQYSNTIHISTVGLKGSMRVKGPVPSQRVHIGKAVHEGMRLMFKSAAAGSPKASAHDSSADLETLDMVPAEDPDSLGCSSFARPSWEERVKVQIVPMISVDIQELKPQDSGGSDNAAAVFIRPRRPASHDGLVSVSLEVTKQRVSHICTSGKHRRNSIDEGANLDLLVVDQPDDVPGVIGGRSFSGVDERLKQPISRGKDALNQAMHSNRQREPSAYKVGQREFEFVAEVTSAPPNSVFRLTKVLTIKPRFVVDNQTGMAVEVKQKGTPDLEVDPFYGDVSRCSCRLDINQRAAFHWDNTELEKTLMVRPLGTAADGGRSEWQWSGGFNLSTREEYFGLRIRHKVVQSRAINIPVNCTVGPSGCVLVTFKSRLSVPPYRIENKTSDVVVYFAQSALKGTREKWNWLAPRPGGSAMAYAWDEPTAEHRLQVQAHVQNRVGRPFAASYDVDKLGTKPPLNLPSANKTFSSNSTLERVRTMQRDMTNVPNSLKERVASVLASEFSKKVYVTVFADGPTRVLRFSDEPSAAVGSEQSILDLAARLKQVEADLASVNGRFLQLHGPAGGAELDLYGRAATLLPTQPTRGDVSRAESFTTAKSGAQAGRIRLRQRGVLSVEGSPLALPRPEASAGSESGENGGDEWRNSQASLRRSRGVDRHSSFTRRHREASAERLQDAAAAKVIQPRDLGHHLANLHIPASSQTVQGSELMQSATAADSALLLGGDLLVTVWQAEGLQGGEKVTHPFVRVLIGEQSQLTSVQWQTLSPRWDEALNFRDVSAALELMLELWDVGGSRGAKQLQKLSQDPSKVIANARFLGSVEVPLTNTLAMSRGNKHWFPLMRRSAADNVSGSIRLSFAWDVTARSLLNLKLAALERVLAQRTEVLCMLNPVVPQTALKWAQEDAQQDSMENKDRADEVEHSEPSTTRSEERSLAERLLAKHQHEEHHSTLTVSVIEARGLCPRSGVVVAFQANQLPNPVVEISVPGHPDHSVSAKHEVNPRWETTEPASYKRLSSDSRVTVRMYDRKGRNHLSLLGENTISCSRLTGDKPMYVWLPLLPSVKKRGMLGLRRSRGMSAIDADVDDTPELQVHLRLQWVRQLVRGQYMNAELSLAGLGLIVMGGLQDELFNLTVDRIQVSAERSHLEARISGSIKRIQLDNQMIDATQPVVLAPATVAHAHSKTAQALTGADSALIEFGIARSFAYSVLRGGDQASEAAPAGNRERGLVSPMAQEVQEGEKLGGGSSSIMSFKEVWITIGELDFQADDGFLEAILSFGVSIPMADVWQDDAWQEQQRKLLTAQFGPKEVETLSMNAVLPIDLQAHAHGLPMEWMQSKELRELQVLRDQSSYSSWYFIERAYIGEINANVTIALTSSVLGQRQGSGAPPPARGGLFSRFIGASGFQLINVNNVPLSLGSWSLDTKLLGRKAMINALSRHYFAQGVAEAHKVLGGAGPAIAAVPLTVVWVGGSFVTLLTGISSGKVGPVGAAQRVGYVFFMSVAQVVSSLSRIGLSLLTFAPPNRTGHFSDSRALTQAVQRPANAFEAFGRCWEELFDSFVSAIIGVLLDPTQGYHTGGLPLAFTGLAKGLLGLAVRPAVGILELVSKGTHGMGLVCLGREAITGSAQRRVRAPGALAEEQTEAVDDTRVPELLAQQQNVVAAWQQALGHMFPQTRDDTVVEVINTQANRTLLLCKCNVALVRSKSLALRSTYKSMWTVPTSEIKIVRGEDDKLCINLEYAKKYDTKCFGVWTIPRRKGIRCGSRDLMERIIVRINRHMRSINAGTEESFANRFDPFDTSDLSIYKLPYTAAPLLQGP